MCCIIQTLETYVPIEGLEIISEHIPYIPIYLYMVDDISFEEHLEALHKLSLIIHAKIMKVDTYIRKFDM